MIFNLVVKALTTEISLAQQVHNHYKAKHQHIKRRRKLVCDRCDFASHVSFPMLCFSQSLRR
jgi:hypothetical protein